MERTEAARIEASRTEAAQRAQAFFEKGYNCCQSVFLAFAEHYGFDQDTAARLSASFGGGVGRLREVCGAVSGMALVCGLECGATDGADQAGKAKNYEQMQQLAARFQTQNGSLICRELLGVDKQQQVTEMTGGMGNHQPQARTEKYYAVRPCKELVGTAADIIEEWLSKRADETAESMSEDETRHEEE